MTGGLQNQSARLGTTLTKFTASQRLYGTNQIQGYRSTLSGFGDQPYKMILEGLVIEMELRTSDL